MHKDDLFKLLVILSVAAVFVGTYYYLHQLSITEPALWIFVPDCPLYVLLAIPIFLGLIRNTAYRFIISIGLAKYGLWTVFVLLYHSQYYFATELLPVSVVFVIGHIGMALVGAALIPKSKAGPLVLLLALGWFLLNDYMDYFAGTRPLIPDGGISLIRDLTIASSFALTLAFYLRAGEIRELAPVRRFRKIIGA